MKNSLKKTSLIFFYIKIGLKLDLFLKPNESSLMQFSNHKYDHFIIRVHYSKPIFRSYLR